MIEKAKGPVTRMVDHLTTDLVPGRECGDCVVCCKILRIKDEAFAKPAGELCRHCTGSGCSVYDQRPEACRTWFCLWRRTKVLPDEARPDRCGVSAVIDRHLPPRNPMERLFIVVRSNDGPENFKHPVAVAMIQMFVRQGSLPVWLSARGSKSLIHPRPEVATHVLFGTSPPEDLRPEVEEWLRRFPPI